MVSARIFLHPRCAVAPMDDACAAYLQSQGFDMREVAVFHEARKIPFKSRYELVRPRGEIGVNQEFERMDGTRFVHRLDKIHEVPLESA